MRIAFIQPFSHSYRVQIVIQLLEIPDLIILQASLLLNLFPIKTQDAEVHHRPYHENDIKKDEVQVIFKL